MSYLKFDKTQLINLEYSLGIEFLRSNRAGAFASSTIINCNTRKYHGLFISPVEELGGGNFLFLSALDETIIQHEKEFHLAVRKYPGKFHPGHKYISDFSAEPTPSLTYRVGGVVLKKERLLTAEEPTILVRYTLEDCHSPTILRLHPFLGFRNVHALTKANLDIDTRFEEVPRGTRMKLYQGYPYFYMQFSKKPKYVHAPDWFYNIEYLKEKERGYEHTEDMFVPGYFDFQIKKGDVLVFAGSLKEVDSADLVKDFEKELKKRVPRTSFENCLENAAQQFFVRKNKKTKIIAGFPWFGTWPRDTFISLPGLTLALDDQETCESVLDTMMHELTGCLFRTKSGNTEIVNIDASLWFIWAIQKLSEAKGRKEIWKEYGKSIQQILEGFRNGTEYNTRMHENGLVWSGVEGRALTWMDANVNGVPVTPRIGYTVELNALWYNAIKFALGLAQKVEDKPFIRQWENIPALIEKSFVDTFWNEEKGYLADYADHHKTDWSVRPNQVLAASMPYSPINDEIKNSLLHVVQQDLLTPRGLRTLSPKDQHYIGTCTGDVSSKDLAYHQGTVWPWLLGHFAEAYLRLHEMSGVALIKRLYNGFEEEMNKHGIGTISEIYDGNPPHKARGAISQAWSVAEVIRMKKLYEKYEKPI